MSNIFEYKTKKSKFIIFANFQGKNKAISQVQNKAIKFHYELDPYSGSASPTGRYPTKINSTHIAFSNDVEATFFDSFADFISWYGNSKKEFDQFMIENNLKIQDIKLLEITFEKPTEKEVNIDLGTLLNYN